MQKVVKVDLSSPTALAQLNIELKDGWKVVQMKDYAQVVSSTGHISTSKGEFGMIFVIEK